MNNDAIELKPGNEYKFLAYDKERDETCVCKIRPVNKDGVFFELEIESYKKYNYDTKEGIKK